MNALAAAAPVGLLVSSSADRNLLAGFFADVGHSTIVPVIGERDLGSLARAALVIVDEECARLYHEALLALKKKMAPVILPMLVALSHKADGTGWLRKGFDDLLRWPFAKDDLLARTEAFLRLRSQSEESLRASESFSRATLDAIAAHICVVDAVGRIIMVNRGWRDFAAANGGSVSDTCEGADYLEACRRARRHSLDENSHRAVELVMDVIEGRRRFATFEYACHSPGEQRWFNAHAVRYRTADGDFTVLVHRNVTERKVTEMALREAQERFRQIAENVPEVLWINAEPSGKGLLYVSPSYERIWGHGVDEVMRNPRLWFESVHPDDQPRVKRALQTGLTRAHETFRVVRGDGTVRWVEARTFPVTDEQHKVQRLVGIASDVTERREAEARMSYLAHFDSLTELPNRALFTDRLGQALAQGARNGRPVGVAFIDLDRFKNINDSLGHGCGDLLLKEAAARLTRALRAGDTVARLSGDEFAAIFTDLATAEDAGRVAEKLLEAFAPAFALEGHEVYVTASIGVALFPPDAAEANALMKAADVAMYRAKELGRNNFQFYRPDMNRRTLERLSLESRLRRALEREEFVLHYQPRIALADGRIAGLESLLRWQPAEGGIVLPGEFIPVLEETGLIVPVGRWVMQRVAAQLKTWRERGLQLVPTAVNLSARQFVQKDLLEQVLAAIRSGTIPPEVFELEITESLLVRNEERTGRLLNELNGIGVRLSIDDFGTGYSNMSYLKRFPLDALKIDRSFVHDVDTDANSAAIALAIIRMAHSLGLEVIAEGVETEPQRAFLTEQGCEEAQGYLFYRPLPAEDIGALLAQYRAAN